MHVLDILLQLLGVGELAPGIHQAELEQRRQALSSSMPSNSIAIVPAANTWYITGAIPYPYRQDADFFYLTGLQQHAVAIIQSSGTPGSREHNFMLFIPPADKEVCCMWTQPCSLHAFLL